MIINSNWKDITLAGQLATYFKLNNAQELNLSWYNNDYLWSTKIKNRCFVKKDKEKNRENVALEDQTIYAWQFQNKLYLLYHQYRIKLLLIVLRQLYQDLISLEIGEDRCLSLGG